MKNLEPYLYLENYNDHIREDYREWTKRHLKKAVRGEPFKDRTIQEMIKEFVPNVKLPTGNGSSFSSGSGASCDCRREHRRHVLQRLRPSKAIS